MTANREAAQIPLFSREVLGRQLALMAIAGGLLAGVVATLYLQERGHEISLLRQQGRQRLEREFEYLAGEVASVRSDVLYLAEQQGLKRFLAGNNEARDELEREYVRFAIRRGIYDQIRFLDTSGNEVVRVNFRKRHPQVVAREDLQTKSDRYYYRRAQQLSGGEVFVSAFDLNVEHGKIERPLEPVLRVLTPVTDSQGRKQGLLALNYSGNHLLRRLNSLSLPGSTLLVNADGQYINGLTPEDAWGWLLGHSRTFPRHFGDAWQRITGASDGQFATSEGLFTFRWISFSPTPEDPRGRSRAASAATALGESAELVLVAFLPTDRQYASATKLLTQLLWMYAGAMILLAIFGWYWARSTVIRRRQAMSIQASETRLRTLSEQLLTAQEQERRSISRELHDQLSQQVTAVKLDLQSALQQQDETRSTSLLRRAIDETDQLLAAIHDVASRIRPSVLDDLGLHDAVETLISDVRRRAGVEATTALDFDDRSVSPKVGENAYRILQECLANVVKHARTQKVNVRMTIESEQLRMVVEDQGAGFDPRQRDPSRLGLLGMQERTELLGGHFALHSQPGSGTRIEVRLPLQHGNHLSTSAGET